MHTARRNFSSIRNLLHVSLLIPLVLFAVAGASAQSPSADMRLSPRMPADRAAIPQQMQFAATLAGREGDTVEAVFRIYAAPDGGEPLWSESQSIAVGNDGRYQVMLGAATERGLPQSVFSSGRARWLGISVERGPELPRVEMASVPYAMKSADAATLAGYAPSEFVTQAQLAATARILAAEAAAVALPKVSLTGSGTANTIAMFTGTNTLGDSPMALNGSFIGLNEANPLSLLDVNGNITVRKNIYIASGVGNPLSGANSGVLNIWASTYSSSLSAPVTQKFGWQSVPVGNNTTSPSAAMELLYGTNLTLSSPTGFSIGANGQVTFAPGQTFPGTGAGTLTAVNTSSPITGGGSSGAVSVGLNEATLATDLEPTYNTIYPQLGAANTFTAGQTINAPSAISGITTAGDPAILTVTNAGQGPGIAGYTTQGSYSMGIYGSMNPSTQSGSFDLLFYGDGFGAGVWADGINHGGGNFSALLATADDMFAGNFFNNSANIPTISVLNNHVGGPTGNSVGGIATVLRAGGPDGVCGINQAGSLSCTGQMKGLVSTRGGARQVETYAVQSAENWLEDYGSGQLQHGGVTVELDRGFAETVNTGVEFHVFLTPGADCKGLYVTNKTATSFEVHELGGGKSSIPFDYKIVAKRSGHETERLVDVTERMRAEAEAARPKRRAGGALKSGPGRGDHQTHD